eukprot:365956-Chlamydomonas_euryale.AAC.2
MPGRPVAGQRARRMGTLPPAAGNRGGLPRAMSEAVGGGGERVWMGEQGGRLWQGGVWMGMWGRTD